MNTHKVFEVIILDNSNVAVFFDSYKKSTVFADRFLIKMHGRLNPKYSKVFNSIEFSNGSILKLGYFRSYKDSLRYRGIMRRGSMKKTALGIKPRFIWLEQFGRGVVIPYSKFKERQEDLVATIKRRMDNGDSLSIDWIEEYNEVIKYLD